MQITSKEFLKNRQVQVVLMLFVVLIIWRIAIVLFPFPEDTFNPWSFAWGASYQIIAIFGAIWGFSSAHLWGGWKSVLGKTIILFAIGLALQSFGQSVYSYYVFTTGDAIYPSIGDIGFFGSIPFYIYGVYLIGKLSGVSISLKTFNRQAIAVIIPLAMVTGSYFLFLYNYNYDWGHPLTVFLDFGYPIGQAIYIAIAIMVFIFAVYKKSLGGIMRGVIILFLIALVSQYLSDFVFLYSASRGLYIPEGINDCMYLASYFLMALSLIKLSIVFAKIKNS